MGVEKDIDIVTIDASNPFGNGHMIPAGILREPPSALRRADIFVLTNADSATNIEALKSRIAAIKPEGLIVLARHAPCGMYMLSDPSKDCSLKLVRGIPVALVSAIGNPGSFRRTVEGLKISVEEEFIFPDHHRYSISDIASISKACLKKGIKAIITTEKDAVKIAPLSAAIIGPDMFVLKISLEIIEHEELFIADYAAYILLKTAGPFFRLLPPSVAFWIGRVIGEIACAFDIKHRSRAYANLKTCFWQHPYAATTQAPDIRMLPLFWPEY